MKSIVFTHKGQRKINQDFMLIQNVNPDTFLMLIADGMGGYSHGEKAAKVVAENILAYLMHIEVIITSQIQKAINKANLAIRQMSEDTQEKMGATIGGIVISKKEALCFWVGDVKIFHFKENKLQFESHSHTLLNEIIGNGSITESERISKFKHIVTRSVQGDIKQSKLDSKVIKNITPTDMFLVCSDGVHDIYAGLHIQQILNTSNTLEEAINKIEKRLLQDAKDNFSLIALK